MEHELVILDGTGHTSLKFNPEIDAQVERARSAFGFYKDRGYLAYTVDNQGGGAVVKTLNPAAATTVLAPQMIGG